MPCTVLLADDHRLVRQGLRALLEKAGYEVVAEAADGREACRLARKLAPEVAVLDLAMPVMSGLEALRRIRAMLPETSAIMLSMHCDAPFIAEAFQAGAKAYVLKTQAADDLIRAIQAARSGRAYLGAGVSMLADEAPAPQPGPAKSGS